jgi:helix-turn-helix protein
MAQPNRIRKFPGLHFADTGWDTNNRKPSKRSHQGSQSLEPFVEASAAGEFLNYSSRTIKQMAREGRIPAHPFGSGARKRWYFLISELAEHLRGQVNSAHGEAGRDKTQRRVI